MNKPVTDQLWNDWTAVCCSKEGEFPLKIRWTHSTSYAVFGVNVLVYLLLTPVEWQGTYNH